MLNDDPTKLSEHIEAARKAIHRRLTQDDYITPAERTEIYDALGALASQGKRMRPEG
jgi:hypothetical protein